MKFLVAIALLVSMQGRSAEPDFIWSKDFFGDGVSNTRTLPFGRIDGNNDGFVGATASAAPRRFINASGQLECLILFRYKNGIVSATGDIYDPNNGDTCPLLSGSTPIRAVEAFGSDICIGGDFTNLGGVTGLNYFACYSPTLGWYQPNGTGNGPNNSVYSIEIDVNGAALYVGGQFTQVNAATSQDSARRIIKTDGLTWQPLYSDQAQTSEGVAVTVTSILPTSSFIFVGSGTSALSWNSSVPEWKTLGTHNGSVVGITDMLFFGSLLMVTTPNATLVSGDAGGSISDFDLGAQMWAATGSSSGINIHFGQLAFGLGPMYATGDFTSLDAAAKGVAVFINNDWQAIPQAQMLGDLNNSRVLEMQQGGLSEFCFLTQSSPVDAQIYWRETVCYNGNSWKGVKNAPVYGGSGGIGDIEKFQGAIIYAGDFSFIGDQRSQYVAKLGANNRWQAISQLDWSFGGVAYVRHLQEYNGFLYATGNFDSANGTNVNQIAKWDGTNWSAAIPGFFATNNSPMIVWKNKLVIAGIWNGLNSIIAWDGTTVEKLDGAFGVSYFEVYQGNLIADNGNSIIQYNNNGSWSDIVSNVASVSSLYVNGNDLYVGGVFSGACNGGLFVSTRNIMRWDGSACFALAEGLDDTSSSFDSVDDMVFYDNKLIVIGRFDTAGQTAVNNLAYWDGLVWKSLDTGLIDSSGKHHMYLDGNDLYVSGGFAQAGDALVGGFAKVELVFDRIFKGGFE